MELKNASKFSMLQLFPPDFVFKAAEKSSHVLHNEAMQKPVSFENWPFVYQADEGSISRFVAKASFSKCLDSNQSSKSSLGRKGTTSKPKSFQTPSVQQKGKKF